MTEDQYRHLQDRLRSIEKAVHYLERKEKGRQNFRLIKSVLVFALILGAYYYLYPYLDSLLKSIRVIQEVVATLPV